jgi:hypothetical protein
MCEVAAKLQHPQNFNQLQLLAIPPVVQLHTANRQFRSVTEADVGMIG